MAVKGFKYMAMRLTSALVAQLDGKTGAEITQRPRCILRGQVGMGKGLGGGHVYLPSAVRVSYGPVCTS